MDPPAALAVSLPPPPPQPSLPARVGRFVLLYFVVPTTLPIGIAILALRRKLPAWKDVVDLYRVVCDADRASANTDNELLSVVYAQPSAKKYIDRSAFEWQKQEGYCAPTTMRCVLKSFVGDGHGSDDGSSSNNNNKKKCSPPSFPAHWIPEQKRGDSDPERFCRHIEELPELATAVQGEEKEEGEERQQGGSRKANRENAGNSVVIRTRTFRPSADEGEEDASYEKFLSFISNGLKDDKRSRVVINYLRPALFGFPKPWWVPFHFLLGIFAGHFSPVIGLVDNGTDSSDTPKQRQWESPLIAIFDVNHKYGGTYLVPARRLFQAVKAKDVVTRRSRAVIVVSLEDK